MLRAGARRGFALVPVLALLGGLVACSGEPIEVGVPGDVTVANLAELTPLEPLPDSRPVSKGPVVLHPPSSFQQTELPTDSGTALALTLGSGPEFEVPRVVVTEGEGPGTGGLDGQVELLEEQIRLFQGGVEIERHDIDWPGAEDAALLSWIRPAAAPGARDERNVSFGFVSGDREVSIFAVAPVDEFEESGVLDVLRTVRLEGS